jgi:NTP pyrophosphatase (non-canonical NTP hydrolase)|nr:MAG TPA: NTP-PPase-like protein [Caudoviricetes sp.]
MPCTYYTPAEERNAQLNSISELKDKVNKMTRNYCEFINAVYESQGIEVLSSVVQHLAKDNPAANTAFYTHQSLDKKQGRPYFAIKSSNPFMLEKVDNIGIDSFKDYVKLAIRTDATKQSDVSTRILHSMVGLTGELSEALEIYRKYERDNVCTSSDYEAYVSELGDVLWHIALYYDATQIFRDKGVDDPLNNFIHKDSFIGLMTGLDNEHLRIVLQKYGYQYLVKDFKHNGHLSNVLDLLLEKAARALDAFKKHYFYKQELDHRHVVIMSNLCVDILKWIIMTSYLETEVTVYTLKEIMEANIKKLKVRYAEKFTTEESENRDYEKESEAAGIAVK